MMLLVIFANTCGMTAIGHNLGSLLMSKIVWASRLRYTVQRLEIWAPQMNMDLIIICGDDTRTTVCAVGPLPAAPSLRSLAQDGPIGNLSGLWGTSPDRHNLNGRVDVVGRCRA